MATFNPVPANTFVSIIKTKNMETLKEFMLIFRFEPVLETPDAQQENEMHKQWGDFISDVAVNGKLVSTHQLGYNGVQITTTMDIKEGFRVSENEVIGGNMIVKAESFSDAIAIAQKCPVILMGGSVEIRDILPI